MWNLFRTKQVPQSGLMNRIRINPESTSHMASPSQRLGSEPDGNNSLLRKKSHTPVRPSRPRRTIRLPHRFRDESTP